jgi:hypothetical protein
MKKYKEFSIGGEDGIFDIATGRDVIIGTTESGDIPLVSHQHDNNGITKYIKRLDNRRLFNHKDTISLADRGVFYATTQTEDFHIGTRVKALTFKNGEQSEEVRLFFVTAINKLQIFFEEYLTNATDKLPELKIMLPVNDNDEIDYEYMQKYVSELKDKCASELNAYLKTAGLDDCKLTEEERKAIKRYRNGTITYKNFKIKRLFNVSSSKKKFNANSIKLDGGYPYVARSSSNNGIRGYTNQDTKFLNDANTISFGQDTATIFYQEKPYFTGDKIKIMSYLETELTSELACYLLTTMRKAFQNFAWGQTSFDESVLNNVEIEMPILDNGKIDYDFIHNFIKALEKITIKDKSA